MIGATYRDYGYTMDPHTGVAVAVAQKYQDMNKEDKRPMLVVSTASPYKFPKAVLAALGVGEEELEQMDDDAMLALLQEKSGLPVHPGRCRCGASACFAPPYDQKRSGWRDNQGYFIFVNDFLIS